MVVNYVSLIDGQISKEEVEYSLSNNDEVPKLFINGEQVGIVSMSTQYVTSSYGGQGGNTVTVAYITKKDSNQRTLFINKVTGEVFNQ